jgi:F0F1-type ATP synthase assembly protein I
MTKKAEKPKSFLQYTSMSLQMLSTILAFVFAGRLLDTWLELGFPIFTLVFVLLGVFGSMYSFIRKL